jgi:hypothetical protein
VREYLIYKDGARDRVKEIFKSIAVVEDPSQQPKEMFHGMCADTLERHILCASCQSE